MTPKLDHRVLISRLIPGVNGYNEPVETFSPLINLWASRQDASAGEQWRASEVGAEIDAHFIIRYSEETKAITPKDILTLENGKTYNITGIKEIGRNHWLELHCVTRADK